MAQFTSDIPAAEGEQEYADQVIIDLLDSWVSSGNSPATLINAMAEIVNEIIEQAAEPVH